MLTLKDLLNDISTSVSCLKTTLTGI